MAKDPAFLFYSSDFLTGTMFMTDEQVGVYIRLLCAQHQHGGRIDTNVIRTYCERITNGDTVLQKFAQDSAGFFNERLDEEMKRRAEKSRKASESVRLRWEKDKKESAYERNTNVIRSENENENENRDVVVYEKKGVQGEEKPEARPKNLSACLEYFRELGRADQAEDFMDHFRSNGWKVGGKAAMKDWKAAARRWVKNSSGSPKITRNTTTSDAASLIDQARRQDQQNQKNGQRRNLPGQQG